jgi:hypothetical protein
LLGASVKQNVQEVTVSLVIHPVMVVINVAMVSNSSEKCFKSAQNGGYIALRPIDSFQERSPTQFDARLANAMLAATLVEG